jgi:hypothetical protein
MANAIAPKTKLATFRAYVQGHVATLAEAATKHGVNINTVEHWAREEHWRSQRRQYAKIAAARVLKGDLPPVPVPPPPAPSVDPDDTDLLALETQLQRVRGFLGRTTHPQRAVQWAKYEDLLLERKARLLGAGEQGQAPVPEAVAAPVTRSRVAVEPEQGSS